ncbi:MAG TPA: L,D-transpeptidase [Microlunatus sp.]|nr:L,D-transpeptidase [Microlunatus sp.]
MPRATLARLRYPRIAAAGSALVVTVVTLLGGIGVLPSGSPAAAETARSGDRVSLTTLTVPDATGASQRSTTEAPPRAPTHLRTQAPTPTQAPTAETTSNALPSDSGTGKRVVFDISDQRVWLVDKGDEVRRSYLVSGSLTDNLDPGTYAVYSRSRHAVGINDSGVMEYFIRFTRGVNAAIGFHSIPTKNGRPLQTEKQLGTPQSHGCIRQATRDAKRLWAFAPVSRKVVVTA